MPTDFLNNRDAAIMIQRTVKRIDRNLSEEHGANEAYSAFSDLIYSEMNAKLKCFTQTDVNSTGRRMKCKKNIGIMTYKYSGIKVVKKKNSG